VKDILGSHLPVTCIMLKTVLYNATVLRRGVLVLMNCFAYPNMLVKSCIICAASRKVAGLIPHEASRFFFNLPNPSGRTYSDSNGNGYQKQKNNVSGEQGAAGA
jgi:hypothetical protein